jgi:DNA-binding NarL/FixJ family response regulator
VTGMLRTIVWAMRRSVRDTLVATRAMRRVTAASIRDRLARRRPAMAVSMRAPLPPRAGPPSAARPPESETLPPRVLEILAGHQEGIRVRDIGNELGIDWRSLPPILSGLVARGFVDQIEQDFYPTGKASRKC